jgi:methylenetetrahydrofolate dehydrogenase (NADP+)/methenyltetrahydrofolate cyclohydrolase
VARTIDPTEVASSFRAELRAELARLPEPLVLRGFLAADSGPSATYAEYTRRACDDVGVRFDLRHVARLDAERALVEANEDPGVHGIFVYYPIFGTQQDTYLRDRVLPEKDVEGLHSFWASCLYANRRYVDEAHTRKAILPCTPLAIVKLLEAAGVARSSRSLEDRPLAGLRACVFNRSEVVGRPLAAMLANDGADVSSFDIDGAQRFTASGVEETTLDRAAALAAADIVITGVPSRSFPLVAAREIKAGAVCLNFSTLKNFDPDIVDKASVWIPRVGPMTVTMALRNTLRLFKSRDL